QEASDSSDQVIPASVLAPERRTDSTDKVVSARRGARFSVPRRDSSRHPPDCNPSSASSKDFSTLRDVTATLGSPLVQSGDRHLGLPEYAGVASCSWICNPPSCSPYQAFAGKAEGRPGKSRETVRRRLPRRSQEPVLPPAPQPGGCGARRRKAQTLGQYFFGDCSNAPALLLPNPVQ